MPAFGNKLAVTRIESGAISGTPQDQCVFFDTATQESVDQVSGQRWEVFGDASVVDDNGTPTYVGGGVSSYVTIGTPALPLVVKGWTGALTILCRAWGNGEFRTSLFGDIGAAGQRGTAFGKDPIGEGKAYMSSDGNDLLSTPGPDYGPVGSPIYADYVYRFNPSTYLDYWEDSVREGVLDSGVPAARYGGNSHPFVIGSRGDFNDHWAGRVQFLFAYKKILTQPEFEAAFANPVYIP